MTTCRALRKFIRHLLADERAGSILAKTPGNGIGKGKAGDAETKEPRGKCSVERRTFAKGVRVRNTDTVNNAHHFLKLRVSTAAPAENPLGENPLVLPKRCSSLLSLGILLRAFLCFSLCGPFLLSRPNDQARHLWHEQDHKVGNGPSCICSFGFRFFGEAKLPARGPLCIWFGRCSWFLS